MISNGFWNFDHGNPHGWLVHPRRPHSTPKRERERERENKGGKRRRFSLLKKHTWLNLSLVFSGKAKM